MPSVFCNQCNAIIKANEEKIIKIVIGNEQDSVCYHVKCFCCNFCKFPLNETSKYHLHYGNLSCDSCFQKLCSLCKKIDLEKSLFRIDKEKQYHIKACLKCFNCGLLLNNEHEAFIFENEVYCKVYFMFIYFSFIFLFINIETCRRSEKSSIMYHLFKTGSWNLDINNESKIS
jgi:hypothetical protein